MGVIEFIPREGTLNILTNEELEAIALKAINALEHSLTAFIDVCPEGGKVGAHLALQHVRLRALHRELEGYVVESCLARKARANQPASEKPRYRLVSH